MKSKRRTHDAAFKARVALEALKGVKAIQQIAKLVYYKYICRSIFDSSFDH